MDEFLNSLSPMWVVFLAVALEILLMALFVRGVARKRGRDALDQASAVYGVLWILRSTAVIVLLLLAGVLRGSDVSALPRTMESLPLEELQSRLLEEHATLRDVVFASLLFGAMQAVLLGRIVPVRGVTKPATAPP